MNQYQTQPDFVSNTNRTISGQLAEWGIDFSPGRVARLTSGQRSQLQAWINDGVDADEAYQAEFASLPEFMENELLEMTGELATDSRESIIEQAINACEAQTPISENPYLFDTSGWHLWRQAYCRWHHGESLDFPDTECSKNEDSQPPVEVIDKLTDLVLLAPRLLDVERTLQKLRRKVKRAKTQRKQLLSQLSRSLKTVPAETLPVQEQVQATSSEGKQRKPSQTSVTTRAGGETEVIRIPVSGPETNRIEILLTQDDRGDWHAGARWSVEIDSLTGQRANGSVSPDENGQIYLSHTAALLGGVLQLSRGQISNPEIEEQVIDYLNLLEEYPGQIAVCRNCGRHWLSDELNADEICSDCLPAAQ